MATDQETAAMLREIHAGVESDELLDNGMIATRLGWTLTLTAECLQSAKEHSLVWGRRTGDKPAPWFTELEVTVQGRRFLRTHDAAAS